MSTYRGFDVLEIDYNRLGSIEERLHRDFVLLDPRTGKRYADEVAPSPAAVRPFTWSAFGREEMAEMRDFLEARKGRAVPFWLPSYQWDLSLAEDLLTDAAVASVEWIRYTQQYFGTTGARRHLALWTHGVPGSMAYYRVSDADDPATGETESLDLDPVAVRDYDAATTVISFLKLCRLDPDLVSISYPDTTHAEATILVREIPLEAPTAAE
jgi:hypothetical protein